VQHDALGSQHGVVAMELILWRHADAGNSGDDPEQDVQGATEAGMIGVLFEEDGGWPAVGQRLQALKRLPYFGR